jgi:hypothetical protein
MNSYMGWWYPALLGLTFLGAYLGHSRPEAAPRDERRAAGAE